MKHLIIIAALFAAFSAKAQQQKQDSLVLQILIDTATYKNVRQLIIENINGQSLTGKVVLENILLPLSNFKLVPRDADKPKELPKPTKKQ